MAFETIRSGALEYRASTVLSGAPHAFTTRLGGVSEGYLASLNLGPARGDRPENVVENYRILGRALGFSPENTVFTRQLHTDLVRRVNVSDCGAGLLRPCDYVADAIISDTPGVTLVCFAADCTPILLYDPVKHAAAAIHAGWRGTAMGIAAKAVESMTREFHSDPADIRAAIGPCISRCCFEVGSEVPQAMRDALGPDAEAAIEARGEKFHVDLKLLNRLWLSRAGVGQIDVSEECTRCRPDLFWSYRAVGNRRGSQAALISL